MKPLIAIALLTAPAALAAQAASPQVAAALADATRPPADTARDAARKPADFLAFAGITPGMKVADYIMGGGYWTRLLSGVVGPAGKVYAYQPAEFIAFRAAYGTEQEAAVKGRGNVVALRAGIAELTFPEPLDAIVTVQNWHDLHLKMAPANTGEYVAGKLFAALKPGGVLIVADNASAAGAGFTAADSLHRAEGAAVRAEIESAGFTFAGETRMWANPADPKTKIVFDPSIRGKADQFVYKFRKPG
ncbi:Predicted methyltransferase [Sphingomonas guangdongensis]|uniref:Predicted methyltransferase n=1 Tax=Sphingomonas guangdongensis TaxID=1141890 RepID=A0A285R2K0_9SPHN|nr:class I SAM-dependent methyltransferase [Sphingomonas guangdongensis]SOB88325.1 Predicted methyltransferase [Sphingomonas guangdongensis]